MQQIIVHKGRTVSVSVSLGFDISADTFESQIRAGKDTDSELIVEWSSSFLTDGTDGELVLTVDNTLTAAIDKSSGYMDLKRISGGEPLAVFDEPLEVLFKNVVTV